MLSHLNGMFAFSIWDADEETLFLARDRLGIKPLYYSTDEGTITWGSNIQSLLRGGVDPILDERSVYDYFQLRAVPAPNTLLAKVRKLEPGHALSVTDDGVEKIRYWEPPRSTTTLSRSEITTEIRSLLESSVQRRLRADVPVGAFLSGGLDSTAIVALMAEHRDDFKTFSIGFDDADLDESDEAEFVASHFGTDHQTLTVDLSATDTLERLIQYNGEPVADPAMVPTLLLATRATEDVKVVLTGEGADELFGGYRHHEVMRKHRRIAEYLPSPLFRLADAASNVGYGDKYLRYAAGLESDRDLLLTEAQDFRDPPSSLLDVQPSTTAERILDATFEAARPALGHRQLLFDLGHSLPERLLYKVDVTTMATGLEARVPFLDHRLVELASQIPDDVRLDGEYKPLLREAVSDLVPERTLSRSKQGFNPPVSEWLRSEEIRNAWLTPARIESTPCLDTRTVRTLVEEHASGTADHPLTLWKVLSYVAWYHTIVTPHVDTGRSQVQKIQ
jgi:asparagine synthase (glutamine-hydrolysing)